MRDRRASREGSAGAAAGRAMRRRAAWPAARVLALVLALQGRHCAPPMGASDPRLPLAVPPGPGAPAFSGSYAPPTARVLRARRQPADRPRHLQAVLPARLARVTRAWSSLYAPATCGSQLGGAAGVHGAPRWNPRPLRAQPARPLHLGFQGPPRWQVRLFECCCCSRPHWLQQMCTGDRALTRVRHGRRMPRAAGEQCRR